ncbi:MAG TPA: hypothetical protein VMB85_16605 [Bryobacteraceae bacterium]|jgi:hypothetical protein|nr:hypothetical protein [Bryobacteraceae bacterium]
MKRTAAMLRLSGFVTLFWFSEGRAAISAQVKALTTPALAQYGH